MWHSCLSGFFDFDSFSFFPTHPPMLSTHISNHVADWKINNILNSICAYLGHTDMGWFIFFSLFFFFWPYRPHNFFVVFVMKIQPQQPWVAFSCAFLYLLWKSSWLVTLAEMLPAGCKTEIQNQQAIFKIPIFHKGRFPYFHFFCFLILY